MPAQGPVTSEAGRYADPVPAEPATATVAFHFDAEGMGHLADSRAGDYAGAAPFPHIVFDDFLPAERLRAVLAEFPGPLDIPWTLFEDGGRTLNLATESKDYMADQPRHMLGEFNGRVFV